MGCCGCGDDEKEEKIDINQGKINIIGARENCAQITKYIIVGVTCVHVWIVFSFRKKLFRIC